MTAKIVDCKPQFFSHHVKRILLIEDHDVNRMFMKDYLEYCGYNVLALSEGANFFLALEKFRPDVILLDLKLPDIDGYSLLAKRKLLEDDTILNIPVIIVSAFAFKADMERAMNLGASRYFVKPVNLQELQLAIEEELNCQPQETAV